MVNPFFLPSLIMPFGKIKAGGDVSQSSTKITDRGSATGSTSAFSFFGSPQATTTQTSKFIDTRDMSTNVTNIIGSEFGGGFSPITRKTTSVRTEDVLTPTQSQEKPISIAPAVFGGGTTTATGESEASSGINPVAIAGVAVVGFLAFTFLGKKRSKK